MIKGHIVRLQMSIFFSSLARLYFGAHLHGLLVRVERIGEQYHSFSTVKHRIGRVVYEFMRVIHDSMDRLLYEGLQAQ